MNGYVQHAQLPPEPFDHSCNPKQTPYAGIFSSISKSIVSSILNYEVGLALGSYIFFLVFIKASGD